MGLHEYDDATSGSIEPGAVWLIKKRNYNENFQKHFTDLILELYPAANQHCYANVHDYNWLLFTSQVSLDTTHWMA